MEKKEHEIVQRALRQVQARRERRRQTLARRGLLLFWPLLLLGFFLLPLPLTQPWSLEQRVWALVHGFCAQAPGHMLSFGGRELPLCARDSGLYLGASLAMAYLLLRGYGWAAGRPARWFWRVFALVGLFFAVDVLNSVAGDRFYASIYPPHNALRLASGLLLGMCLAVPLLWALSLSFAARQPQRSVFNSWGDLLALLALEGLAGLLLWSGWPFLYVPLTVLTVLAMLALLLAGVFLWILLVTKGKQVLESCGQVLPALFWASVISAALLAGLSALRYLLVG
ncbi:MAG: DUF2085 domain-containing protein [Chloroflexia bacterium]|nr:DUF2085 domain-containing protein [Chloroflexia bacterium]